MTPLPKRKHSSMRIGKRKKSLFKKLPKIVICKSCGSEKLSHFICPKCQKNS